MRRGDHALWAKATVEHQLEHLGDQVPCVRAPDVEGGVANVHLQERDPGAAVEAAETRADAVGGGVRERDPEVFDGRIDDQRRRRAAAQLAWLQGVQAEALGVRAHGRPRVDEGDVARAERARDQAGVERSARAEGRAPVVARRRSGPRRRDPPRAARAGAARCGGRRRRRCRRRLRRRPGRCPLAARRASRRRRARGADRRTRRPTVRRPGPCRTSRPGARSCSCRSARRGRACRRRS